MTTEAAEREVRELIERGRKLPMQFREVIANELLLEEATDEERAALKAELTRRWERLRSGEDVGIPAEEFIAKMKERAKGYKKSS